MENGFDGKLANKMSGLGLNNSASSSPNLNDFNDNNRITAATTIVNNNNNNNDSLFQVMKAVEAAEATIRQQRIDQPMGQRSYSVDPWNEWVQGPYEVHPSVPSVGSLEDNGKSLSTASAVDPTGTLVLHKDLKRNSEDIAIRSRVESRSENSNINWTLKVLPGGQAPVDNAGLSLFSSPSAKSYSPGRYQMEAEYDPQFNLSGHALMQTAEVNNPSGLWKQAREHDEEILQLRKHLADYSLKVDEHE